MNMWFQKLAFAINNIYVSSSQNNNDLLYNLETLISCNENANVIFNNGSSEVKNHDFTSTFKDELNKRKQKFYRAFRSQELSEYYDRTISEDDKFVLDKFCPNINQKHQNLKSNWNEMMLLTM